MTMKYPGLLRVQWNDYMTEQTVTLTGDDIVFSTVTSFIGYPQGYYMAQKEHENVLLKVVDNSIPELGITVQEMQEAGYKLTAMAVMSITEYKMRMRNEYERGLREGADSAAESFKQVTERGNKK